MACREVVGSRVQETLPDSVRGVAVIGAGPAGLVAASFAARAGASVVLIEQMAQLGPQPPDHRSVLPVLG